MPSTTRNKLVLFDIDGTLIDTGGAGLSALRDAFIESFDLHLRSHEMPKLDLAGSTCASKVVLETCREKSLAKSGAVTYFPTRSIDCLPQACGNRFWLGQSERQSVGPAVIQLVVVAQLVESRIVIPVVAGSSPVDHPTADLF